MAVSGSYMNPASRAYYADDLGKREKRLDTLKFQVEEANLQKQLNEARGVSAGGGAAATGGGGGAAQTDWYGDAQKAMQLRWQDDDRNRSQNYSYRKQERRDTADLQKEIESRQAGAAAALYRSSLAS